MTVISPNLSMNLNIYKYSITNAKEFPNKSFLLYFYYIST